jgi:hypothetical protein
MILSLRKAAELFRPVLLIVRLGGEMIRNMLREDSRVSGSGE